ncbi:MAG: ABC transporter substrate-binding protein [Patescibacteria group bacterium]
MSTPRFFVLCQTLFVAILMILMVGCKPDSTTSQPVPPQSATPQAQTKGQEATPGDVAFLKGKVLEGTSTQVGFIAWGGDYATFYGNGGLRTRADTIFAKHGLNLQLVAGDDMKAQAKSYREGRTPYLRGTFEMVTNAIFEQNLCADPTTCPVYVFQMTWSQGDHLVVEEGIKTIKNLKGKRIALQRGGPHMSMLYGILMDDHLSWTDVQVVWCDNLSGKGSPIEALRSGQADAAFAITPDMIGLTGGLDKVGTGAEGTVKNARVLVSTAQRVFTIADTYWVNPVYLRDHANEVRAFTVAYLESMEALIKLRKAHEASGSPEYKGLLALAQDILGKGVLPTSEDAHGLLLDAQFVGYAGNLAFIDAKNEHGFNVLAKQANKMATSLGQTTKSLTFAKVPDAFWQDQSFQQSLSESLVVQAKPRFNAEAVRTEIGALTSDGFGSRNMLSFTISFEPNQMTFSEDKYRDDYDRALTLLDKYPRAILVIRGHADPTAVLRDFVNAAITSGALKRTGTSPADYQYFYNGEALDLSKTPKVVSLVESGTFKTGGPNPRETLQEARNLTRDRAQAVRSSFITYASKKGKKVDESQITFDGVGVAEPVVARPRNDAEAAANRRVEFALTRVTGEASTQTDFDF